MKFVQHSEELCKHDTNIQYIFKFMYKTYTKTMQYVPLLYTTFLG